MSEDDNENNSIEDEGNEDDEGRNDGDEGKERTVRFDNGVLKESKEIEFVVWRKGNEDIRDIYYNQHQSVFDVLSDINNEMVMLSNILDNNSCLNKSGRYNYYNDNDPKKGVVVRWRSHANLLYSNWLNYFVYQETPYDIKNIK